MLIVCWQKSCCMCVYITHARSSADSFAVGSGVWSVFVMFSLAYFGTQSWILFPAKRYFEGLTAKYFSLENICVYGNIYSVPHIQERSCRLLLEAVFKKVKIRYIRLYSILTPFQNPPVPFAVINLRWDRFTLTLKGLMPPSWPNSSLRMRRTWFYWSPIKRLINGHTSYDLLIAGKGSRTLTLALIWQEINWIYHPISCSRQSLGQRCDREQLMEAIHKESYSPFF
jgi:hypothetical protein